MCIIIITIIVVTIISNVFSYVLKILIRGCCLGGFDCCLNCISSKIVFVLLSHVFVLFLLS